MTGMTGGLRDYVEHDLSHGMQLIGAEEAGPPDRCRVERCGRNDAVGLLDLLLIQGKDLLRRRVRGYLLPGVGLLVKGVDHRLVPDNDGTKPEALNIQREMLHQAQ